MSLPLLRTRIPGPRSRALARQLRRVENRNVTYTSDRWPIFWQRARGANVWDADGNRYLDLTAAFGVASVGHTNSRVAAAIRKQAGTLLHAMGDVHPNELKLQLARELVALSFGRWGCRPAAPSGRRVRARGLQNYARVLFANSGAEAVEAALKTAAVHTDKPGIIAFGGAYHGLTYGALAATAREFFRTPFIEQLGTFVARVPFGTIPEPIPYCGAVLVEPIQGRGGIVVPPDDFLPQLRHFCDEHGMLLILDEIYTGFCRTGHWFACEHWGVVPDLICVGKALGGGLPISACIGKASVMDSWPESEGEAIHTSTFLGNPLACAAALASIAEMKRLRLWERAAKLGAHIQQRLPMRGKGLMLGLEVGDAPSVCERLLQRGIIAIPEGEQSEVLGLTPPLTISQRELDFCLDTIEELIR
ncbi:MAG: aminotransferase class III-fold pyridoxal phosphate-dependent enzyme [Verrucomicrobia bacterium]|nr:aminotransferase class III-fold pyridoxal phosphate-dependent enzyme [Verrucomicrobiota bacterium]